MNLFKLVTLLLLLVLPVACKPKQPVLPPGVDHYTCPMHPSVHSLNPNDPCPICGMDLVPVMKGAATQPPADSAGSPKAKPSPGPEHAAPDHNHNHDHVRTHAHAKDQTAPSSSPAQPHTVFTVPPERQQQIGVTYATVERQPMRHSIRAVGVLEAAKTLHWEFTARVDGYVEKLFVSSPGELVTKGQPLLSVYSPDLRTAEREFVSLLAMRDKAGNGPGRETAQRLVEANRRRLVQWNVAPEQIRELERSRKPQDTLTLLSPFDGVVEAVPVDQGRNVKVGDHLVDVADISTLWVWADFFENELAMLKEGQAITVTSKSYPNEKLEGKIALINPFVDPARRTTKVRIDIANPEFKLRPGMYVNASLEMDMGNVLVVPVAAVMPTGTRNLVFVDRGGGKLEPRFIQIGARYGEFCEVQSGVAEGDRVVASANFLIDAEAKLQGALQSFER